MFEKLSDYQEFLATEVVDIAVKIHSELGPGLLESVYEKCFCHELYCRSIAFERQNIVPVIYRGCVIDEGLRLDIVIDNLILIELKAQENFHPVWEAQLLSYLKLTGKRLGFLINFHVPRIKNGIKRMIL